MNKVVKDLLAEALSLLEMHHKDHAGASQKAWVGPNDIVAVTDTDRFAQIVEEIYLSDKKISEMFSRKTIFKIIEERLVSYKRRGESFVSEDDCNIFSEQHKVLPRCLSVFAPISGVRLDSVEKVTISAFEIGPSKKLALPLSNASPESGELYIKIDVVKAYDHQRVIEIAEESFLDFVRIIIFISGKHDKTIQIKTGLPAFPSMSRELMYVQTSSYQITDTEGRLESGSVSNKTLEKIPVDNPFFCKNLQFEKLLNLYAKRHAGEQITDFENRIINAAIAVGESAKSRDIKNSILYSCIALEILFSFDDGSLFQKSIADRLADTMAFIVAKDKEARLHVNATLKKVYQMRSALVHGGNKKLNDDYIVVNALVRMAICELLANDKYTEIKKIDQLYAMVKEAQYSYS